MRVQVQPGTNGWHLYHDGPTVLQELSYLEQLTLVHACWSAEQNMQGSAEGGGAIRPLHAPQHSQDKACLHAGTHSGGLTLPDAWTVHDPAVRRLAPAAQPGSRADQRAAHRAHLHKLMRRHGRAQGVRKVGTLAACELLMEPDDELEVLGAEARDEAWPPRHAHTAGCRCPACMCTAHVHQVTYSHATTVPAASAGEKGDSWHFAESAKAGDCTCDSQGPY